MKGYFSEYQPGHLKGLTPHKGAGEGQGRKKLSIMPTSWKPSITSAVTVPIRITAIVIRERLSGSECQFKSNDCLAKMALSVLRYD